MAIRCFVLSNDATFDLLGFIFVIEAQKDKAEATTSLGHFFSHDDGVFNLSKLGEVIL